MKYAFLITFLLFISMLLSCNNHEHPHPHDSEKKKVQTNSKIDPTNLIGKTIKYQYGESIYHVTIDSETDLHWEAITGDEKGTKEEETYKIAAIDDQKLFLTWGEANGIGVSQVLDFEKGIVYNHLLRGRDISIGTGEIKIVLTADSN